MISSSQYLEPSLQGQMDLETENRIAAILLKEAAELRQKAEKEGVHVYLQQPKMRGRPNSRFLTATVLGVQQGLFCRPVHSERFYCFYIICYYVYNLFV